MNGAAWNTSCVGDLSDADIAQYLHQIGAPDEAAAFEPARAGQFLGMGSKAAWYHTEHVFGFIEPTMAKGALPIVPVAQIQADPTLKRQRIKVALDKLHVHKYPGRGTHTVLVEFRGRNQGGAEREDLQFASTFRVNDGEAAGVVGHPVFVGLTVADDGVAFGCRTINVKSGRDEDLLSLLDNDAIRQGLGLLGQVQPALKPFVSMTTKLVQLALESNKNKTVQAFALGLDFDGAATSARLRLGSYVVVQTPGDGWSWDHWRYDKDSMRIVPADNAQPALPHNYMIFSVSRFAGEGPAAAFDKAEPAKPAGKEKRVKKAKS